MMDTGSIWGAPGDFSPGPPSSARAFCLHLIPLTRGHSPWGTEMRVDSDQPWHKGLADRTVFKWFKHSRFLSWDSISGCLSRFRFHTCHLTSDTSATASFLCFPDGAVSYDLLYATVSLYSLLFGVWSAPGKTYSSFKSQIKYFLL